MNITTTVEITPRRIADLMVTAIEGGVGYWCDAVKLKDYTPGTEKGRPWYDGESLYADPQLQIEVTEGGASDDDEPKKHLIGLPQIEAGFKLMAEKYGNHFNDFMIENEDSCTADVWFQLVVLGEIVYG